MLGLHIDSQTIARWAVWFGLLGVGLGSISAVNRVSPDLYHEMALAREAWAAGSVPIEDLYAYTPTVTPCVHHEWGAGLVFYGVSMSLGSAGLLWLKYGGALLVGVGCAVLARQRGASAEVFGLLAPAAILCGCIGFFSVRAQLFTLLGTLCLLYMLQQDRQGRRAWICAWLPTYVLWLNMHGGFLVGVGLLGLYTAGRWVEEFSRDRSARQAFRATGHLWGAAAAMVLLFPCNPYGWRYAPYLWQAVRLDRPFIAEWQPVWRSPLVLLIYAASWLPLLCIVRRQPLARWFEVLMVVVTAVLALQHIRHLSIYAVVWACYVPALVEPTPAGQALRRWFASFRTAFVVLWIALGVLGIAQAVHNRFWELRIPTTHAQDPAIHYPVGAVDYLQHQAFAGNVMVPFEAGAFVSWKLYPAVKVSCDGRYEVAYPPAQVEELCALYTETRHWQATLRRYPPDLILIPRPHPLESLLDQPADRGADPPWPLVYRDDGFALYARPGLSPSLPVVDRVGRPIVAEFP